MKCLQSSQLEPHELACKTEDGAVVKLKLRVIQGIINLCKKLPDRCVHGPDVMSIMRLAQEPHS